MELPTYQSEIQIQITLVESSQNDQPLNPQMNHTKGVPLEDSLVFFLCCCRCIQSPLLRYTLKFAHLPLLEEILEIKPLEWLISIALFQFY